MEEKLNTKTYQTISQRMNTEEAACALIEGSRRPDDEDYPETGLEDDFVEKKPTVTAQLSQTLTDDPANIAAKVGAEVSNVAGNVAGKVGNVLGGLGKGIGGFKFGGGGFF
ncbi:hypothetical protein Anas_13527 [Armadillidium nasatum]|uniref:Uncharacterized protein n=1 Tax=Armadillidium nasatum TaxID=96803 RepID=A0A5N5T2L5_9CRUS|nr:hypothetical protein Anas_13527 [Armadillidium nasatum]